jgi:hypothetical protein
MIMQTISKVMNWLYKLLNIALKQDRFDTVRKLGLIIDVQELRSTPHRHIIEINLRYGFECWMLLTMDEDALFELRQLDIDGKSVDIVYAAKLIVWSDTPARSQTLCEQGFEVRRAIFRR